MLIGDFVSRYRLNVVEQTVPLLVLLLDKNSEHSDLCFEDSPSFPKFTSLHYYLSIHLTRSRLLLIVSFYRTPLVGYKTIFEHHQNQWPSVTEWSKAFAKPLELVIVQQTLEVPEFPKGVSI